MKRLLASLLCATLILSPVGNASTVYATEAAEVVQQVQETEEGQQEETVGAEDTAVGASDEQDAKENVTEAENSGAEEAGEGSSEDAGEQKDEAASGDEASTEGTPSEEETATEDTEEAGEESADVDELPADDAVESEVIKESAEAKEAEIEEADNLLGRDSSAYFTVDEDGTLVLKEGATLPVKAVVPAEAKKIPSGIFDNDKVNSINTKITFEEDSVLEEIADGAFRNSKIEEITIPEGVTRIGPYTFSGAALKTVDFKGDKVTYIGNNAFSNTNIIKITAPNVTEVGDYAFSSCSSLKRVSMEALTTIGVSAFSGCTSLDDVPIPSSLRSIGTSAFAGCALNELDLSVCTELTLGDNCFQNNDKLESVTLPNNLEIIPKKAFFGDVKLRDVYFGTKSSANRIREINISAFENCSSLKSLVFYNVYDYKSKAFEGCGGITSITIWNTDTDSDAFSIAEDAFPNKSKVVMKGYDGKVEEYANKRGYTYETLYPKHKVTADCSPSNSAAINLSKTEATKGTKIRVTVTPVGDYQLSDITISETITIPSDEIILIENTTEHQVFEFTMPDGDEKIKVTMVEGAVVKKPLSPKFEAINGYTPDPVGDISTFDVPGRESRLVIRDKNGKTKSWYWNFTSSNSKVVSISTSGVVRSTGVGSAKLTATLKTDSSKKVEVDVKVLNPADIVRIELDIPTSIPRGKIVTPVIVDGEEIPVIQFEKAALVSGAKDFNVGIKAYSDGLVASLITTSKWTSTDSKVATITSGSSTTNTNTVKVVKNAVGETLITVSVLNKGDKTPRENNKKSFIIRVVDATPRLQNSTLTVDSRSKDGTQLKVVTVYGYEIKNNQLILTTKKTDSKGIVTYPRNVSELDVEYDDTEDAYYICSSNPQEPFEKTYDGKLFLEGTLEGGEGQEETFHIPITKLTVTNKALNPTLKTTGKINLFYNTTAEADLTGMVTVTQSLKDLEVKKVELISEANHKKAGSEANDSFAANFNIVKKNNTTFEITRTDSEMVKVGGKNVTKGYLKITYKGYAAPVEKSFTVPTCDTAPDYVLDKTSATASRYSSDQEFELHLVDKKTKKIVQDLSTLDRTEAYGNIVGLGFTTNTTAGVFKEIEDSDVVKAQETDTITLKVDGTPSKAKAYIYVRMSTWSRELTYTFTLNTSNALPTVKFSATTVTLNNTYSKQAAVITVTENQPEAKMAGIGPIQYTGKKNADAAAALIDSMKVDTEGENLSVKFSLGGTRLPKGTYAFKVTPKVTYDGDEHVATKVQTIKIVVAETNPTIKFNSSTFKFNASILDRNNPSNEEVTRTFKLGNLPTGVTGEVDDSEVKFNAVGTSPDFKTVVANIDFADTEASATILNNTTTISNAGKTLKYKVHNLKVATDSGDSAVIPDFNIAIQLDKKAAAVKVKGTGSINPLDTSSRVTYTATLSNISSEIDGIKIWEKDGNKWYGGNKEKDRYSEHFTIVKDDEKDTVAYLYMKPDKQLENGKKYNLTLVYTLKAVPGDPDAPDKRKTYQTSVTVTPKQVLPKVTTDVKEATIYAGQSDRSFKVTVTQKKSKDMMEYVMTGVAFADGTSNAIKNAFRITGFDSETGVVTVTLVNPSAIVQNNTYTLNFVTSYKNQAAKSTGNKFSVKVTVKK
jgi:hypothetical protein